jgi:hypothetical protein
VDLIIALILVNAVLLPSALAWWRLSKVAAGVATLALVAEAGLRCLMPAVYAQLLAPIVWIVACSTCLIVVNRILLLR